MGIRWSEVEANDRFYSPKVKALFPAANETHVARHSDKRDDPGVIHAGFDAIRDRLPKSPIPGIKIEIK